MAVSPFSQRHGVGAPIAGQRDSGFRVSVTVIVASSASW
jgi:hypothetical protein